MSSFLTSKIVSRVVIPGSRIWHREKRAIVRRWKRAMLLPETVLLAAIIIGGTYASDHFRYTPGAQQAMAAANAVIQDGVPTPGTKRKQRIMQERLRDTPQDLMKLTSADMIGAFGYADIQRQDGMMTMLQFRGTECILDVYMNGGRPVHYEFRARMSVSDAIDGKDDVRAKACVKDILKSRRV
jgi:hypothetical protein